MFNTYITEEVTDTVYVPYTKTVIEKKAPTDESVKLLRELEEKAMGNIVDKFSIKSSIVDGVCLVSRPYDTCLFTTLVCVFDINGKRHTVRKSYEEYTPEIIVTKFFADTLKQYIYNEILESLEVKNLL